MRWNFFTVYHWMMAELGLKGTERDIFALVYSYSRQESGCYYGSFSTTAELVGVTRRSAISSTQSLLSKGLIEKEEVIMNGSPVTAYRCGEKISLLVKDLQSDGEKISPAGGEKISPINYSNRNYIDNINNNPLTPLPYESDKFRSTWELLLEQPKWKSKTKDALAMSAQKLGRYPESVAIQMMEDTIAGGWQGLFPPKPGEAGAVKTSSAQSRAREAKERLIQEINARHERERAEALMAGGDPLMIEADNQYYQTL